MLPSVTFAAPYWIGVLEMERDGLFYAARLIFGAKPGNEEVYMFVQDQLVILVERLTDREPRRTGRGTRL